MNKFRRKSLQDIMNQLEELKSSLEDIQTEEEEYRDNHHDNQDNLGELNPFLICHLRHLLPLGISK